VVLGMRTPEAERKQTLWGMCSVTEDRCAVGLRLIEETR
jgi:hypothetical protein